MAKETRQKILSTTSTLLERQGYHATGLNQIVKESGTPRGSLYYYFPDGKEELAAEAITQRMDEMANHARRFLGKIENPAEAVRALVLQIAESISCHACGTGAPIAAVALEASNTNERLRQTCEKGYGNLHSVIAAKLVMGGHSAETAASLATTINAAIEGGTILARTQQSTDPLTTVADALKTLILATPKA